MIPGTLPSTARIGPPGATCAAAGSVRAQRPVGAASGTALSTRPAPVRARMGHHEIDRAPNSRPAARQQGSHRQSSYRLGAFVIRRRVTGGSPDGAPQGAGPHIPVLLREMVEALGPRGAGLAIDGTFGAGGYTRALLATDPDLRVLAIDRDPQALTLGQALAGQAEGRLTLVAGRFGDLDVLVTGAGETRARHVVLDVGISSMQIDAPERGFSFRHDGPLDMRMGGEGASAADLVNGADEARLADIVFHYGEERRARAVARAIVETRRRGRIQTTGQLAELVASVVRVEPGSHIHPATRTFQGLRIAVNDELGELVRALHAAERILEPGGRLAVVTFHSLEDRIVKQFFAARSGRGGQGSRHMPGAAADTVRSFRSVTKGPVLPTDAEIARNPRARSAKLRAAERTDAPVPEPLASVEALAALPDAARGGARR